MKLSEILTDESKWTKGCVARNRLGDSVLASSPKACRFCLAGVISRLAGDKGYGEVIRGILSEEISRAYPGRVGTLAWFILEQFNDHPDTTFADVMKVIQDAGV